MQLTLPLNRAFARYRRGRDPAALGELFDLAAPEVLRIATYLVRDAEVAEDLVQQTFLGAIEGADRFDDGRAVMPWMLGILANQVRAHKRREARSPDVDRLRPLASDHPARDDPARIAADREIESTVRAAIDRLDEPYREILRLNLDEGLAPKEIAASLERPQGTVRSQLHRGLDMLRKALPIGLSLGIVSNTRGLAAVKTEVLAAAGSVAVSAGVGAGVGASVGAGSAAATGVAIMSKKSLLVFGFIVIAVALLGWQMYSSGRTEQANRSRHDARRTGVAQASPQALDGSSQTQRIGGVDGFDDDPTGLDTVGGSTDEGVAVRVQIGDRRPAGVGLVAYSLTSGDPRVYRHDAITDAEGRARLGLPSSGEWAIIATTGVIERIRPGETSGVDLLSDPGITVAGRVLDRRGAPVANAAIEFSFPPSIAALPLARSDGEGRFVLRDLMSGALLTARSSGWVAPDLVEVTGSAGDRVVLTLTLDKLGGDLLLRVRDEAQQPIAGAVVLSSVASGGAVRASEPRSTPRARAEADATGGASLVGLAPGAQTLVVRAPGYRPTAVAVTVTAGVTTEQTVVVPRSAVVRGRVQWANGKPVARVPVEQIRGTQVPEKGKKGAYTHKLLRTSAYCDTSGRYRLDEIAGESFTLRVRRPTGAPVVRAFRLAAGEEAEWNVTLGAAHPLRGRVVDADGKPMVGWLVSVNTPSAMMATARTDDDGSFSMAVPDATAEYRITANPMSPNSRLRVTGVAHGTLEPILLRVDSAGIGSVHGRLVGSDGRAIGGVHIALLGTAQASLPSTPTSHKDGSFRLTQVPAGKWGLITFDATGKRPLLTVSDLDLTPGATLDVGTLTMREGGRIRVQIEAPDDIARVSAFIAEWYSEALGEWKVDAAGARISPLLCPATVRVQANGWRDGKLVTQSVDVEVRSGETTSASITLR